MNSIRSSKGVVLGVLLAASLLAVGTAAAVTVNGTAPDATATGESVTFEATVDEPFRDAPDQWTLQGSTELQNPTWTVQVSAQGDPVDTIDSGGQSFSYDLDSETGATEVQIEVSGDVPELSTFDYENLAAENYTVMSVSRMSDGTATELEGGTFGAHRYTAAAGDEVGSQEARDAIDTAIEEVGGQNDKIDQAISSYNNENFENARDLANEAEGGAQSSQLLMIGAGVVVVLALVGGGVYYWRANRDEGHKLQ